MRAYLRDLRKSKGLSQAKAASAIGISQTYYSSLELGNRQPNMAYTIMEKFAAAFEVPVQKIIADEKAYLAEAMGAKSGEAS